MDCLHSNGGTVATILAGIWRRFPPKLEIPAAKVASAAPLLLKSGAGALGWWRVRHLSPETLSFSLRRLYITYLRYAVQAAEYEAEIGNVFSALRSSGIEPILIKGWAIARVYPEAGLRPCGDIDLCVSPYAGREFVSGPRRLALVFRAFPSSEFGKARNTSARRRGPLTNSLPAYA
ncbi:MAG: hypothetical protein DMG79_20890 [Acidobacteria bacterium]|nr:MAG: hypothetical protein DMG79_20890 [Acidobacteriota bacterium]